MDDDRPKLREASIPVAYERCAIERWRGYVSSTFFARMDDGTTLLESKPFRARGQAVANEGRAARAYAILVAALEDLGWQRLSEDPRPWYATQFARAVATPRAMALPLAPERPLEIPPPADLMPEPLELWTHPVETTPEPVEVMLEPLELPALPSEAIPEPVEVKQPPVEVEPAPAPEEAAPVNGSAKDGARRRRRPRMLTLVSAAGVLVAVGAVALGMTGYGKKAPVLQAAVPPAAPAQKAAQPRKPSGQQPQKPVVEPTPVTASPSRAMRLSIGATDSASWLEIRKRSSSGPVVFSGELAAGRTLRLKGTRFWARFGAAGHLAIAVNGHPVALRGTLEHVFAAPRR
jgi:hypothetical protein